MELLVVCLFAVVSVSAEAPNYNSYSVDYQDWRNSAPYPAAGWRPSGPSFGLPARQQLPNYTPPFAKQQFAPPQTYGTPEQNYGPPPQEYGPPPVPTTEAQEPTTTELPTTTEILQNLEAEIVDAKKNNETDSKNDKLVDDNSGVVEQGVYYVYHPTGLLQRVAYITRDDMEKMAYTAQLKYENVEPIRGPIYGYDARTGALRLIQV